MYKLLLCWRYLLTRYLALACIISVMLGVATLIVVNSVMGGFSTKLRDRLHGLLSDVLLESTSLEGFGDAPGKMEAIRRSPIGDKIAAMTPTVEVFAMLQFRYHGQMVTRPVHLIGVDPAGRAELGGFQEHLKRQKDSATPSFELTEEAREYFNLRHPPLEFFVPQPIRQEGEPPPPDPPPSRIKEPRGIILGNAIGSYRDKKATAGSDAKDIYVLQEGDDVIITTVGGEKLMPVSDRFVVCDFFKSEMSEYDSSYVFVPLDYLQHIRTMERRVTSIQIKLKDFRDAREVTDHLAVLFPHNYGFKVSTWEDKQGALLAAISIEKGILNVLLFLIIAVAGFGILAIFAMIVVEKTRDIGILKALGASNGGVMSIFLGYGLLLGVVGAGLGSAMGLSITININEIEQFVGRVTGQELFDRSVYYFDKIPTDIQPLAVFLVNLGAVGIAVLASIMPSLRAALLHPVRALRYE